MIRSEGDRLSLSGPLTVSTVAGLVEEGRALVMAGERCIDLSDVTQVDSAALALLLTWMRAARGAGHHFHIAHPPVALVSLASLYDVDSILPLAAA